MDGLPILHTYTKLLSELLYKQINRSEPLCFLLSQILQKPYIASARNLSFLSFLFSDFLFSDPPFLSPFLHSLVICYIGIVLSLPSFLLLPVFAVPVQPLSPTIGSPVSVIYSSSPERLLFLLRDALARSCSSIRFCFSNRRCSAVKTD